MQVIPGKRLHPLPRFIECCQNVLWQLFLLQSTGFWSTYLVRYCSHRSRGHAGNLSPVANRVSHPAKSQLCPSQYRARYILPWHLPSRVKPWTIFHVSFHFQLADEEDFTLRVVLVKPHTLIPQAMEHLGFDRAVIPVVWAMIDALLDRFRTSAPLPTACSSRC